MQSVRWKSDLFCFAVQGLGAVVAARSAALVHLQGHLDEHLRWISGSRTQPDGSTAELLKGEKNSLGQPSSA